MMATWYERLSVLDTSFLAFERPPLTMHIAAVALFDAAPLTTRRGGIDIERIRAYVASRLPSLPRYRQCLAYVPVENHPVWVDDDRFDLRYHVRHTSLPRPGSDRQLQELCACFLERPLDRARPLWEIWVIEGVADNRVALLMKVHHCMVDGVGGVELLAALLRPTPDAAIEPLVPWEPRPAPSERELLRDELQRRARMSVALVRGVGSAAGRLRDEGTDWSARLGSAWRLVRDGLRRPAASPLNHATGPHRRFQWLASDLGTLKAVKQHGGGTLNDVVLATVSGAVRGFFEQRNVPTRDVDFRVAVPVNMRTAADRHDVGNRVSAWLVPLPIDEPRPARRLLAVREASQQLKATNEAMGVQFLTQAAEWTSTNLLTLGSLLTSRVQPFNLIVTNVPGPQFPLYLLGARMVRIYPYVPLFENQGLGIALFSYDGTLYWGFNGDWDMLPDLDDFVRGIDHAVRQLRRAVQRQPAGRAAVTPAQPNVAPVRRPRRSRARLLSPRVQPG